MITNLGKVITILAMHDVHEISIHEDVDAWHAPSECHRDVSRGEADRWRAIRKHAEAVARRPLRVILREAKRRGGVCLNTNERSYARLFSNLYRRYGFPG